MTIQLSIHNLQSESAQLVFNSELRCTGGELSAPTNSELGELRTPNSDEVHIWVAQLDASPAEIERLKKILSPDEQARADRFRVKEKQAQFIVARGVLRELLGEYLSRAAETLQFHYNSHGKPLLDDEEAGGLRFNLAHSASLAVYAMTLKRDVGVDVEYMRPGRPFLELAERFFARREAQTLRELPPSAQMEAFYRCWTCKEAFVKAKGHGLTIPLHQFETAFAPGEAAALRRTDWDPAEAGQWALKTFSPAPGYVGTVAFECRM
jgi:4'-phosphopantetheinyl transferase